MTLLVAIDGASKDNGKPYCISAAGLYYQVVKEDGSVLCVGHEGEIEHKSTNQRGELRALLMALKLIKKERMPGIICTDSEYLFNAMTKGWITNWARKGWKTALGEPVKNCELWKQVAHEYTSMPNDIDIAFYHIKGHVISVGAVTTRRLMDAGMLWDKLQEVYEQDRFIEKKAYASDLFVRNNCFIPSAATLKNFVCMNMMADAVATRTLYDEVNSK